MTLKTVDLSFIIPKESTNLIVNPSFEVDLTGYTPANSAISRAADISRRGVACCGITPQANQNSGVYYAVALTSGTQYSFSADVYDRAGMTFSVQISNSDFSVIKAVTTWTGTGYWKRRSVTWTADASATFNLSVVRSPINSTTGFYTDGWQLEVGAVSTYFDGDMTGYVVGETAYRWNGTPHASTSWRSGQTRSGGTLLKLSTYAKLMTILGLGMAPVTNISIPSSFGGSFYQNTVTNDRAFSLIANINGGGDYAVVQRARKALIAAVNPDLTTHKQQVLMQYDALDANGLEIGETLEIAALYEGGLEGDGSGNAWNEKVGINFKMFLPLMKQQGEKGVALGYQTTLASSNNIVSRTPLGIWGNVGTGTSDIVRVLERSKDGAIFAGGDFATAAGVADTSFVARWNANAATPTWTPLDEGADGKVYAMKLSANGDLYVGGMFSHTHTTGMTPVANTAYIAKWDGAAWSALGQGMNNFVYALAIGPSGEVYAAGTFTHAHATGGADVADTTKIAKWDGSAWTPLATGADDTVNALAIAPNGDLYAGGLFHNCGAVPAAHVAKWNGTAWTALGTGTNDAVNSIVISPDGSVYAGGEFTSAGGALNTAYVAKWNGSVWSSLGTGLGAAVHGLTVGTDGYLYARGHFLTAGGVALPDRMARWNGSTWFPVSINLSGTPTVYSFLFDAAGSLYVGYDGSGTSTFEYSTVINNGSAPAYPKILFTGPGDLRKIKNFTTGKEIIFGLTLLTGETAILNLDPQNISFVSSFRGDIFGTILPGSDLNWILTPGVNYACAFIYGSTSAASAISMTWRDQYGSTDEAIR